jgi:hypothetical protein
MPDTANQLELFLRVMAPRLPKTRLTDRLAERRWLNLLGPGIAMVLLAFSISKLCGQTLQDVDRQLQDLNDQLLIDRIHRDSDRESEESRHYNEEFRKKQEEISRQSRDNQLGAAGIETPPPVPPPSRAENEWKLREIARLNAETDEHLRKQFYKPVGSFSSVRYQSPPSDLNAKAVPVCYVEIKPFSRKAEIEAFCLQAGAKWEETDRMEFKDVNLGNRKPSNVWQVRGYFLFPKNQNQIQSVREKERAPESNGGKQVSANEILGPPPHKTIPDWAKKSVDIPAWAKAPLPDQSHPAFDPSTATPIHPSPAQSAPAQ